MKKLTFILIGLIVCTAYSLEISEFCELVHARIYFVKRLQSSIDNLKKIRNHTVPLSISHDFLNEPSIKNTIKLINETINESNHIK